MKNTAKLYFEIYRHFVEDNFFIENEKSNQLKFLEINDSGNKSSTMWDQLTENYKACSIENLNEVKDYNFHVLFLNFSDGSLVEKVLSNLNFNLENNDIIDHMRIFILSKLLPTRKDIDNLTEFSNKNMIDSDKSLKCVGGIGTKPYKILDSNRSIIKDEPNDESYMFIYD